MSDPKQWPEAFRKLCEEYDKQAELYRRMSQSYLNDAHVMDVAKGIAGQVMGNLPQQLELDGPGGALEELQEVTQFISKQTDTVQHGLLVLLWGLLKLPAEKCPDITMVPGRD